LDISRDSNESESTSEELDLRLVHHSLLGLVNTLASLNGEMGQHEVRRVLIELRDATIRQFSREEFVMNVTGYVGIGQHHRDHDQFLTEIEDQIDTLGEAQYDSLSVSRKLQNLLLLHVANEDISFFLSFVPNNELIESASTRNDNKDISDSFDEKLLNLHEPMRWSARHATAIPPIDEDHKIIFSRIREIVDARESADKETLSQLLARLGDETATHFKIEEEVMLEYEYEFLAAHQDEHRKLLDEFACQVEDFRNDNISAELMCRFVYGWFVRHIQESDIPLSNAIGHKYRTETGNPRPS